MRENNKHLITSAEDVLNLWRKNNSAFVFNDCEIRVGINLYDIIKENPVEGIEIIPDMDSFQQTERMSARITPGLYVTNLKFSKFFGVFNCSISGPVSFNNVIFEQGLQFHHNKLQDRANFNSIIVNGEASFTSTLARNTFTITKSTLPLMKIGFKYSYFEQDFSLFDCSFPKGIDLSSSHFKQKLQITRGVIIGLLNVSRCKTGQFLVTAGLAGKSRIEIGELDLSDTVFQDSVQIRDLTLAGLFKAERSVFDKELRIDHCIFLKKVRFPAIAAQDSIFIDQCNFSEDLSFSYATLNKTLAITATTFNASLWFTGTKINGDLWIGAKLIGDDPLIFDNIIGFEGSIISAISIVRLSNINSSKVPKGTLKMHNALIRGLLDIREVYLANVTFNGTVVTGNLQDNGTLANSVSDWHSARLLKNEAKKINNTISALSYYRREMELHAKNLRFKQTGDWLLLKLNSWSNDYGTSWIRGLFFTIFSGFIFFYLFILSSNGYNFVKPDCPALIQYIWLPSGLDGLISLNHTINGGLPGAFFFVFGKVLIAYGIYQTITAFRKYL